MSIHYQETRYGFEYGAAKVERVASDEKQQWVVIGVTTPKGCWIVRVTKTGRVRVFSPEGEELTISEVSDDA